MAVTYALCSMQLETLLGDVLRDFDLARAAPHGGAADQTDLVHATLKPGRQPGSVTAAWLEIDRATHVVHRLVLSRNDAAVTYVLTETVALGDEPYRLESHLDADARIYTRSKNPEMRRQKLREPESGSKPTPGARP
jgi:hypothetical protein